MHFSYQHEISDRLWETISKKYESEDYAGAILDAIFLLAETLRDRCDVELDGVALIGKVFGGANPLLKINNFRTESEKNEQKGAENILRGVFQAIRNPRAHEKIIDDKKTCDTFISFIDYFLKVIEKSKSKFEINDFCSRVFDPDFVESKEYADLLVKEVPEKKRFDVLLEIIERRKAAEPNKYSHMIHAFLNVLSEEQKDEITKIVSGIIKTSNDEHDFRIFTTVFQSEKWAILELSSRLRAENKLIKSFENGSYNSDKNRCNSGSLGTWLKNIADNLKLADQFQYSLAKKLSSDNYEEVEYVFKFFRNNILIFEKEPNYSMINAINKGLRKGDKRFYDLVENELSFSTQTWAEKVKKNFDVFEERDLYPYHDSDVPF